MAKKKLEWNLETDFVITAFYSQERLYRLAWLLNESIKSNFSRISDIKLNLHSNSSISEHHLYVFENEEEEWGLKLIQNQGSAGVLVKHNPAPLAILKAHGELSRPWLMKIEKVVKEIPEILAYRELEVEKLRNNEIIQFDV